MRERMKLGLLVDAPGEADRNLDGHVGDGRDRDREVELQAEPLLQAEQNGGADQHRDEAADAEFGHAPAALLGLGGVGAAIVAHIGPGVVLDRRGQGPARRLQRPLIFPLGRRAFFL